MSVSASYGQFCPVAMAAEIICTRWTALILREFLCGTTRFNDLRKGVPAMSPALLSKRLKELAAAGVIERCETPGSSGVEYSLTDAGEALRPVVMALGFWGQSWIDAEASLRNLDPTLLMWDMRRSLDVTPMPAGRRTIQFLYPEISPSKRNWWLVVNAGMVDLCRVDPGFPVDLVVRTSLRTMTKIWMGLTSVSEEARVGRLELDGDPRLATSMQRWLGLSPFSREPKKPDGHIVPQTFH